MVVVRYFLIALGIPLTGASQSVIFSGGVVNAASFTPGAAVAPGGIAAAFGAGLAASAASANAVPLPTTLGGVSVTIGGVPAPLFFVAPGQINFQVPRGTDRPDASQPCGHRQRNCPCASHSVLSPGCSGNFYFHFSGLGTRHSYRRRTRGPGRRVCGGHEQHSGSSGTASCAWRLHYDLLHRPRERHQSTSNRLGRCRPIHYGCSCSQHWRSPCNGHLRRRCSDTRRAVPD